MKIAGARVKLADLDARFLRFERVAVDPTAFVDGILSPSGRRDHYWHEERLELAHGVSFICPKCYLENKGRAGAHRVTCWFEGRVPDDANPGPGRWTPSGSGLSDLTFVPGAQRKAVSVLLTGGCKWHGFVVGGLATVPA